MDSQAEIFQRASQVSATGSNLLKAELAVTNDTADSRSGLEALLVDLQPRSGSVGLLLSFDTDTSENIQGYRQFYDFDQPAREVAANKTLYLTRTGDEVSLSVELDYIASPHTTGFIYAGQARYLEAPRTENCFGMECIFGFDYSRVWTADSQQEIQTAKDEVIAQIKNTINTDFAERGTDAQHVTDYEKVSYITDGFYVMEGFWSQITGGAAWFQAYEKSNVIVLSDRDFPTQLSDIYSAQEIEQRFQPIKDEFGDFDWGGRINYFENSVYTLARVRGNTHLIGLVEIYGNAHRRFQASSSMGIAPEAMITYDNPPMDFDRFKDLYPTIIDFFVSPNENTVFILTDEEIIGIDVFKDQEIFRQKHNLIFNKVIMVEWAIGDFVDLWQQELTR
ncbi:MAG: hypothetical protein ACFBSF_05355 [Leptolyngbyaceae cyanobacterium]